MIEKEIGVRTADGEMTTFVVRPDGTGPFPVAVVYQDGVGYREQVKQNARRFAADGYYCVAADLFYRSGKTLSFDFAKFASAGMDSDEAKRMISVASSVTPDNVVADTKAIFWRHRVRSGCRPRRQGLHRLLHGSPSRAACRFRAGR